MVAKAGLRPGIPPPSSRTPTCPVPRLVPLVPLCRIPQSGCTCPPAREADPRRGALAHVCSPGPGQHTCPQVTGGDCGCLRCFCPVTLFSIPPELRSALLCSYCGHFQGTEPQCPIPALWLFLAAHLLKTGARSQVLPPVMTPVIGQQSQQGSGTLPSPRTLVQSWTPLPGSMRGWPSAQPSLLRPCRSGGVNQKARYLQDGRTSDPRPQWLRPPGPGLGISLGTQPPPLHSPVSGPISTVCSWMGEGGISQASSM